MKTTKQSHETPISRALTMLRHCPICNTAYSEEMFHAIEKKDEAHLLHGTCAKCNQSVLALVMTSTMGVSSVGMITDLTAEDIRKMSKKQSISEDELFSFHSLLTKNNLFEQSVLTASK